MTSPRLHVVIAFAALPALAGCASLGGGELEKKSPALADMEEICERVAVMHTGAIRFVGAPGELLLRTGSDTLERAFLRVIDSP